MFDAYSGLILTTRLFPNVMWMFVSLLCIYALYYPFLWAVLCTGPNWIYLTDFKPFFWPTRVISNSDHLLKNACKFSQHNVMCEFCVYFITQIICRCYGLNSLKKKKSQQTSERPHLKSPSWIMSHKLLVFEIIILLAILQIFPVYHNVTLSDTSVKLRCGTAIAWPCSLN